MWLIILSWCASITLTMSLAFCLCWRKKTPIGDWQGLDGMVIQKNPDENVNHLPSGTLNGLDVSVEATGDNTTQKKNVTTTRRSLPDIPADQNFASNWEPTIDNSSEHYATLEQYSNERKTTNVSNGVALKSLTSQYSSASESEKPYERVKYDKMSPKEHPYAQLQPVSSRSVINEENQSTPEERMNLLRTEGPSSSGEQQVSSRSRRSSMHNSEELDIPAASAVAGAVAASPELPYMTPPVTQMNFSGDSQDSSKGYTSISVREPLADIIAQTKNAEKNIREMDPHYSTLSDDSSDDVYTTIADPKNTIYTNESETYARIEPLQITVEAEINHLSQSSKTDINDELYEPPPDAPSVLPETSKQVSAPSYTHSRQASSSSSTANLGSPKPEKRQANSPLPPPPTEIVYDFHSDKKSIKNLDDMYAKVHKTKKEGTPDGNNESFSSKLSSRISILGQSDADTSLPHIEDHDYETLKSRRTSDPCYEKINSSEEPGYVSIHDSESLSSSDPGYEVLKNKPSSDLDPNYEQLRHKLSNASDFSGYSKIRDLLDGYSVVNKVGKKSTNASVTNEEPNYESMPSETKDSIVDLNDSESDVNYESVAQMSNYESILEIQTKSNSIPNLNNTEYETGENSNFQKSDKNNLSDGQLKDNSKSSTNHLDLVDENGIVQI